MDKQEILDLMKFLADGMRGYSEVRAGGNLGSTIQGFLNLKASENIERGLNRIADELAELRPPIITGGEIENNLSNQQGE